MRRVGERRHLLRHSQRRVLACYASVGLRANSRFSSAQRLRILPLCETKFALFRVEKVFEPFARKINAQIET